MFGVRGHATAGHQREPLDDVVAVQKQSFVVNDAVVVGWLIAKAALHLHTFRIIAAKVPGVENHRLYGPRGTAQLQNGPVGEIGIDQSRGVVLDENAGALGVTGGFPAVAHVAAQRVLQEVGRDAVVLVGTGDADAAQRELRVWLVVGKERFVLVLLSTSSRRVGSVMSSWKSGRGGGFSLSAAPTFVMM